VYERLKQVEPAKSTYRQAAQRYPAHYYGNRAAARLAALSGGKDTGWATNPNRAHPDARWTWPDLPDFMDYSAVTAQYGDTVSTLARLRQWDECLQLLPEDSDPILKSWILANLTLPLDAINVASTKLAGEPKSNGRWEFAYPLLYAAEISTESKHKHLDPMLVHALIREESRYNHLALSRSNAHGLMQLLPGTAYGAAKSIGLSLGGNTDIFKPENNIKLGTQYLSYVARRFNGSALHAVASYNGGPNAVQAWNRSHPGDTDIFVENVPFQETRDYIRKVFGTYWTYGKIYKAT
jgi:soluble lytic murein transglycosylase